MPYLEALKFNLVGYGCTTCIGNSGPLPEAGGGRGEAGRPGGGGGAQRQPQFRRPHQSAGEGELSGVAAAGGGVCARRAGSISICRRDPLGTGTDGQAGLSERHLADARRKWTRRFARRSTRRCSGSSTRRRFEGDANWQTLPVPTGETLRVGSTTPPISRSRRTSRTWWIRARRLQDLHGHARAGAAGRFGHDRSHFAGGFDCR